MLLWLIGGVVCLFLLIEFELTTNRKYKKTIEQHAVALNTRAVGVSRNDTIFVVLPMYRPQHAGAVLARLFETAYCPQRVFVGILEQHLPNTQTALESYSRQLHGSMSPSFIRNIRYKEGELSRVYGGSIARQEIINTLFEDQTFILCVHQHSWFLKNWDKSLIDTLLKVHEAGGHALSQFPIEVSGYDNSLMARDSIPATFPVFEKFRHGLPAFKGRFVDNYNPKPFRVAVASYRCFFATAEVFVNRLALHDPGIPLLAGVEADFLLSLELWTQGYYVFSAPHSILVHHCVPGEHFYSYQDVSNQRLKLIKKAIIQQLLHNTPDTNEPLVYVEKLYKREKNKIRQFCEWLGVDVEKRHAAGHAVMGLLPECTDSDIVQKYGSIRQFEMLKNQFYRGSVEIN